MDRRVLGVQLISGPCWRASKPRRSLEGWAWKPSSTPSRKSAVENSPGHRRTGPRAWPGLAAAPPDLGCEGLMRDARVPDGLRGTVISRASAGLEGDVAPTLDGRR